MTTKQQSETLVYFTRKAHDWKQIAISDARDCVNVIRQRNDYVLKVLERRTETGHALDVGCGSGDLVCEIASRSMAATGVDFSPEMIRIAEENAQAAGLSLATFHCSSIFEFDAPADHFDLIAANGFIEYISLTELDSFFEFCSRSLADDGSLVIGSRNRLFNICSLNAFTEAEIRDQTVAPLLEESIHLASGAGPAELLKLKTAPLQNPDVVHARTGVDVSTRFQFTPAQLIQSLARRGLQVRQVYPIHIHAFPPGFGSNHPALHTEISNLLQQFADTAMSLVPYASSFMLHAVKTR